VIPETGRKCRCGFGNKKFGGQEALVVFDDVFIPNEYVFLNGEVEFAGMLVKDLLAITDNLMVL
jgi:aromatic ring hydroxylase